MISAQQTGGQARQTNSLAGSLIIFLSSICCPSKLIHKRKGKEYVPLDQDDQDNIKAHYIIDIF